MSFRTVVITKQSKLSYKNRFLVVKKDLEEKYIHLSEIDTIIVDSISVSLSSYLLKELSDNMINMIFCDEKHNPFGELKTFYSAHNSSKKIIKQMKWTKRQKDDLWKDIVKNKLSNQMNVLKKAKKDEYQLIENYRKEVTSGDRSNREAHAAKVYFKALFGKKFIRNNPDSINASLNYGYAILLSTINKEIIKNGYLTQIGIHHKNEFNEFNLTCDLMEVFRPVIDHFVYFNKDRGFNTEYKLDIVNILNRNFNYKGKKYTLKDIIERYVKNVFDVLEEKRKYQEFIYEG